MAWAKLKTRLISAVVLIAILLLVTCTNAWIFSVAACVISLMVLRELLMTFRPGKDPALMAVSYLSALAFLITGNVTKGEGNALYIVLMLYILVLLSLAVLKNQTVSFSHVKTALFSVLYAVFFLMPLSFMRHMDGGLALVFLAFIGAWLPDTAAYFVGSAIGKHKLIESISPKKTVEGSVGALAGAVISYGIYGGILIAMGFQVHYVPLLILAILCGAVAQLGDLSASLMKRAYGAKDFGNMIPGHGGMLDRVDSLMFITPVVYCFISLFPVFS